MPKPLETLSEIVPRRVCVVKPSSLGDVVHALPTVSALRERWPEARISWVVNRGLRSLVEGHPDIDEAIPFDRAGVGLSPKGLWNFGRFLRELRERKFDVAIDLQGLLRSAVMTRATGAPIRVGLSEAREGGTAFYTHVVPSRVDDGHAVSRMFRIAEAFGVRAEPRSSVASTDVDHRWAESILADLPRPCVVFNMGARWLTKRWPPAQFAEVARRAVVERGASIVAVGAPEDAPIVQEFVARLDLIPVLDLVAKTTLPQLAALSVAADVFVSNDTGPLHLAAAAGAKVVGVYTCTNPKRTGPFGSNAIVVQSCVWCAPSYVRNCERLECMSELSPDRVWPAVARQLAGDRLAAV